MKQSTTSSYTDTMVIHGISYIVNIYIERRTSCRAAIGKKAISIRIPTCLPHNEKHYQIQRMKQWANNKIQAHPEKYQPRRQKHYNDNDILTIGDSTYTLHINYKDKKSSSARLTHDTIELSLSLHLSSEEKNKTISTLLSRCISHQRLPQLKEKIHLLNMTFFNQPITNIYFKNNLSNWGSCSTKGNINISSRLLFAPDDVLTYVCIHELAHLIEPNHSSRFWSLVTKAMPEYKEKEQWLTDHAHECRF